MINAGCLGVSDYDFSTRPLFAVGAVKSGSLAMLLARGLLTLGLLLAD